MGKRLHLALTPALVAQDVTLSERLQQHRDVCRARSTCRSHSPVDPLPAHPQPSPHLGLTPQVQLLKLRKGQVRELVEAHWRGGKGTLCSAVPRAGRAGGGGSGSYSGSCGCRRCAPRCAACWPGRCAACAGTPRGCTAARAAGTCVRVPRTGTPQTQRHCIRVPQTPGDTPNPQDTPNPGDTASGHPELGIPQTPGDTASGHPSLGHPKLWGYPKPGTPQSLGTP